MTKEQFKKLVRDLESGDEAKIIGALKRLREDGKPEIIPHIINVLIESENDLINSEIVSLLGELKGSKSVELLVNAIDSTATETVRHFLVQACWESGLDFSAHLGFFVDLAINDNYLVCLESLTLIENLNTSVEPQELLDYTDKIEEWLSRNSDEKDPLLQSLKEVLVTLEDKNLEEA